MLFRSTGGYDMDAAEFGRQMAKFPELGVSILGGCCGTTPDFIAALAALPDANEDVRPVRKRGVCSASHMTDFGGVRVIGERINPTGKKRLKEALVNNDLDYVCRLGLEQIGVGAQVLDVNVGTPGIDEPALIAQAVPALQAITDTPLQIDTSNYEAMERALRLYNGKPMLNSVNGK